MRIAGKTSQPEFLVTLADIRQMEDLFTGRYLKGHGEPRVAMVGRSNVGKSSLINQLTGARLAQTSAQPGKTRAIHFYHWKEARRIIADLPGYGYAKASKEERQRWEGFIQAYLKREENLDRALVLLDARYGPTPIDLQAIDFLSSLGVALTFVFSKADTLKTQAERARRKKEVSATLEGFGVDASTAFWVSIHDPQSVKKLRAGILESS
ncbi:MAG: ribosome biogenesis GTP-binding protein YihA/YsxC [Bdellovibrionia bacterium]